MNAILALARKDLKLLFRDRFALFWIFAFPLMFALFFGAIFGSSSGGGGRGALSLAIVDEDRSGVSQAIVTRLAANESVAIATVPRIAEAGPGGAESGDGAEPELASAPPEYELLELADAREAVQKGRKAAYLRIPAGYGDNPYAVFGAGGDDAPRLEVGIDPGRRAEAGFLQGVLMESIFGALQDRLMNKDVVKGDLDTVRQEVAAAEGMGIKEKLTLQAFLGALDVFVDDFELEALTGEDGDGGGFGAPVDVVDVTRERDRGPRSTFDVTFPQAIVWGLMSVAMSFAITLVRERSSGTLLRLRMAPIGRAQLLGGKALACFVGCLVTMAAILIFGVVALGVRFDSLPLLALAMVSTATCFTGLMMTISVLGKTEAAVAGSSWGLMMPFAMVGGGMIPLIAMPPWLVTASALSPFKWAIVAVEGAIWRGFDLGDMLLPCGILLGFGAVFFALGVLVFRKVEG